MGKLKTISTTLRCVDARTVKIPTKQRGNDLYVTKDWQTLRDGLIAKRGRRCERCGRTKTRIFGDHIVELQDGGSPLDEANIELLCGSCHTEKTAAARAKRLAQRY